MAKLRMEDVMAASIMQEHGRSIRAIARDMGVPESTLRYHVKRHREGAEDGRKRQPEACAPWHDVIMSWAEANRLHLGYSGYRTLGILQTQVNNSQNLMSIQPESPPNPIPTLIPA